METYINIKVVTYININVGTYININVEIHINIKVVTYININVGTYINIKVATYININVEIYINIRNLNLLPAHLTAEKITTPIIQWVAVYIMHLTLLQLFNYKSFNISEI